MMPPTAGEMTVVASNCAELVRQHAADLRGDGGVLQQQGALEKLAAMETGAKDKMPVKQGAGLAEQIEDFVHSDLSPRKLWKFDEPVGPPAR